MAVLGRSPAGPRLRLAEHETTVLGHLIEMLETTLGRREAAAAASTAGEPADSSPAQDSLADLVGIAPGAGEAPDDPVLRRLLPDAYPDDADAASDFRRYTEAALLEGKEADIAAVRESLQACRAAGPDGSVTLDAEHVQALLRVLTDTRLMLGSLLGFETDDDPLALAAAIRAGSVEEGARMMGELFEWLGQILGDLVDTLEPPSR